MSDDQQNSRPAHMWPNPSQFHRLAATTEIQSITGNLAISRGMTTHLSTDDRLLSPFLAIERHYEL